MTTYEYVILFSSYVYRFLTLIIIANFLFPILNLKCISEYILGDWKGRLYALFGLHRLDKIKITDAVRLAGLDFVVMFAAVGVFVAVEKLQKVQQTPENVNADNQQDGDIIRRPVRRRKKRKSEVLYWTGETFVLLFLAGAGILHPSLSSSVYFLTFLLVCTWLACNQKIGKKYLQSKVPLLLYCAVHFVCVYLYQVDYVQEYVPPDSLTARYDV